jgi:hypothetical protein
LSLPTLPQALAVGWSRDTTKKANFAACVGECETPKGKRYFMSEQKAKATEKSNMSGSNQSLDAMTRPQALAVSWTGLEALAKARQLIIYNDKTTGVVWFGIANAKISPVGKDAKGNAIYDLIDATLPTDEANTRSVGNAE